MHGLLALSIAIGVELLVLIAAMHLLSKAKKETNGKFFNFMSYLIVTIATIALVCTIVCGICHACRHCKDGECKEIKIEKHMDRGMSGHGMMMKMHGGCNMEEMDGCCMGGDMKGCCKEMSSCGKDENCPFDKDGKCTGDESKCMKDMKVIKDTVRKVEVKPDKK